MEKKKYLVMYEENLFKLYEEDELREILKEFEFDYIQNRIGDLYSMSKRNSTEEGKEAIFRELEEIQQWNLKYYKNISLKPIEEVIADLVDNYDFEICKYKPIKKSNYKRKISINIDSNPDISGIFDLSTFECLNMEDK